MSETEAKLLGNLLDALDRLYDQKCSDVDIWALLFATASALGGHRLAPLVHEARGRVEEVVRSGYSEEDRNGACLAATGDLRLALARIDHEARG